MITNLQTEKSEGKQFLSERKNYYLMRNQGQKSKQLRKVNSIQTKEKSPVKNSILKKSQILIESVQQNERVGTESETKKGDTLRITSEVQYRKELIKNIGEQINTFGNFFLAQKKFKLKRTSIGDSKQLFPQFGLKKLRSPPIIPSKKIISEPLLEEKVEIQSNKNLNRQSIECKSLLRNIGCKLQRGSSAIILTQESLDSNQNKPSKSNKLFNTNGSILLESTCIIPPKNSLARQNSGELPVKMRGSVSSHHFMNYNTNLKQDCSSIQINNIQSLKEQSINNTFGNYLQENQSSLPSSDNQFLNLNFLRTHQAFPKRTHSNFGLISNNSDFLKKKYSFSNWTHPKNYDLQKHRSEESLHCEENTMIPFIIESVIQTSPVNKQNLNKKEQSQLSVVVNKTPDLSPRKIQIPKKMLIESLKSRINSNYKIFKSRRQSSQVIPTDPSSIIVKFEEKGQENEQNNCVAPLKLKIGHIQYPTKTTITMTSMKDINSLGQIPLTRSALISNKYNNKRERSTQVSIPSNLKTQEKGLSSLTLSTVQTEKIEQDKNIFQILYPNETKVFGSTQFAKSVQMKLSRRQSPEISPRKTIHKQVSNTLKSFQSITMKQLTQIDNNEESETPNLRINQIAQQKVHDNFIQQL